jgi:geranylgeranyl pyrophosphate synthase
MSGAARVQEAMRYAVLGRAQRIRPVLALRIARLAGADGELTLRAAAAVELLHCASLVVDDLPCMDDETVRRDQPSAHVVFGEPTTLLASFGLVALAARSVVEVRCSPTELSTLIEFQIQLLKMLDPDSLIAGQDLDLRLTGEERDAQRTRVSELKTVPLFELAARAGLLLVDGEAMMARGLRRFAREYGLAFQMTDDYLDGEIKEAVAVEAQLSRARACLTPFEPAAGELEQLVEFLHERIHETSRTPNRRHR